VASSESAGHFTDVFRLVELGKLVEAHFRRRAVDGLSSRRKPTCRRRGSSQRLGLLLDPTDGPAIDKQVNVVEEILVLRLSCLNHHAEAVPGDDVTSLIKPAEASGCHWPALDLDWRIERVPTFNPASFR